MPFENSIDINQNITTDLKQIVKECFSNIFQTLGEKNFRRWIHTRELSKDIKNLVFDWMSEEDKEKKPGADGFAYFHKAEIRIRRPESAKDTAIHEIYHLMTRHSKRFGTYINEGITEYLKGITSVEGPNSYMENVRMVEFLHKMLGDSLIKAYLLGKDESFDEKFAKLISHDHNDLSEAESDIKGFYNILEKRHKILHPISKEEVEDAKKGREEREKELEKNTIEVKDMIQKIILGKAHQMAQNLEFYQEGKITNLEIVGEWINAIPYDLGFTKNEMYDLLRDVIRRNY